MRLTECLLKPTPSLVLQAVAPILHYPSKLLIFDDTSFLPYYTMPLKIQVDSPKVKYTADSIVTEYDYVTSKVTMLSDGQSAPNYLVSLQGPRMQVGV